MKSNKLFEYEKPIHIRFIEYMPIGHADQGWINHYLPISNVLGIAAREGYSIKEKDAVKGNGPSETWSLRVVRGRWTYTSDK